MQNRAHPRHAVAVDVVLVVGSGEVGGRTENVSAGGLCAEVDRSVPLGEGIVARLSLVFPDDDVSEAISLGGRIVWCTPIDKRYQIGIQFTNVSPDARRNLDLFVRFLAARPGDA